MKLNKIIEYLNSLYPEYLKASYDNVGLMVGSNEKEVNKVLLALDLTREVMDEAIKLKADLIITHHPLLFKPLKMIDTDKDPGSIVKDLIKYDISNYSMHTNFDSVKMNDYLGALLGLTDMEVLSERENIGVVGSIPSTNIDMFINNTMKTFDINEANYYGEKNLTVQKVGIVGGSGSSLFDDALNKKVDIYITGDVSYSRGVEAKRMGLNVLDCGHHIEALYTKVIKNDLNNLDKDIIVFESTINPIPYTKYLGE